MTLLAAASTPARCLHAYLPLHAPQAAEALFQEAKDGNVSRVRRLLRTGCHPDAVAEDQDRCVTALMSACTHGHHVVVEELLRGGADVNKTADGVSALQVTTGSGPCLQALLNAGAAVNHADGEGQTALHAACQEGHLPAVKQLLGAGADTAALAAYNGPVDDTVTPLHMAAEEGHADIVRELLEAGVSPDQETVDGARHRVQVWIC